MNKYDGLHDYLLEIINDSIILSYSDIESIIGDSLPNSAYKYDSFWGNGPTHVWLKPIHEAGWEVIHVSHAKEIVELRRVGVAPSAEPKVTTQKETEIFRKLKAVHLITNADMERASKAVEGDEVYGAEANLIWKCFKRFPLNNDYEIVAMKVGLIDVTNSTNISRYKSKISVNNIVDILFSVKDLDKRIEIGDISVVSEIAGHSKDQYNLNLFSFASKYCTYHNLFVYGKDDFSIFDTVLMKNLPKYVSGCSRHQIDQMRDTCDYEAYYDLITRILDSNQITCGGRRRKLDNLVWYYNR